MKAARRLQIEYALVAFVVTGVSLVIGTWLLTGGGPGPGGIAPFALLVLAWFGLRATRRPDGVDDAPR